VKLYARKAYDLARETLSSAWRHDSMGQAKAAAYSMILFFFPLMLFIVATLVATNTLTVVFDPIQRLFPSFLPQDTRTLIWDYVNATSQRDPTQLLVGSFVVVLWTGWGFMSTFIEGVNRAYGLHEERTVLRDQIAALKLLGLVGVPVLLFGILVVLGSRIEAWMDVRLGLAPALAWKIVNNAILLATMAAVNGVIYYFGAHRRQTVRDVAPGAILAALIWVASTAAFRAYVVNFGRYNVIYGSLGAAIVLFGWMYLACFAVLLGAEFNVVVEHALGRNRKPATPPTYRVPVVRGRPRPG
jgi:membrane protein